MSWLGSIRSYADPRQVGYLILFVTNRCNYRCNFCFYGAEIEKGLKPDEMTVAEIEKFAPTVGPLLQLSLTGGEPFLRAEFTDIAGIMLTHTDARYVTIPTNGSMPERIREFLETLLPKFPNSYFRIVLSIEGYGERHDELRSMPGAFGHIEASYRAISPLRERFSNLVLDSNSVFTAASEETLLEDLARLHETFRFDNMSVTYARGSISDPALMRVSRERYERINAFLESLERRKEKRPLHTLWRGVRDLSRDILMRTVFEDEFVTPCVAGRKLVVVSETGDVFPCEILGKSMGRLRDFGYDLGALMKSDPAGELRGWIKDTKCKCSFECALAANVVWSPSLYPKLAEASLRNLGRRD